MVAAIGRLGWSGMLTLWLEVMDEPLGSWTVTDGSEAMLVAGLVLERKWLEQPLSRMADVVLEWARVEEW